MLAVRTPTRLRTHIHAHSHARAHTDTHIHESHSRKGNTSRAWSVRYISNAPVTPQVLVPSAFSAWLVHISFYPFPCRLSVLSFFYFFYLHVRPSFSVSLPSLSVKPTKKRVRLPTQGDRSAGTTGLNITRRILQDNPQTLHVRLT